MTHDELINAVAHMPTGQIGLCVGAVLAVLEIHKPTFSSLWIDNPVCRNCMEWEGPLRPASYPCPTIQAIKKEVTR